MKDRHKKEKKSTRKHHRILWVFAFFLVVGIGVTAYILLFSAYTRWVERETTATGKEDMTLLEKIVYIADYIEPARNKAPRLPEIRKIAFEDLDRCMYAILHDTLEYLDGDPQDIDQATIRAYDYYKKLVNAE